MTDRLDPIENDKDVYHGPTTNHESAPFVVDFHEIKKYKVEGLSEELNMVKCHSLSAMGFLANNDINLTATCFEVDFSKDNWQFLFSRAGDRSIQVMDSYYYSHYSATTCVCMAFKKVEMQQFNLDMPE